MMNSEEIISVYEVVSMITDQMLIAAKSQDWEKFSDLESNCAKHIQTLRQEESPIPLPPQSREKKVKLIQKILADDREIRDITEPWMAQLSAMMRNTGTARKLTGAYGSNRSA